MRPAGTVAPAFAGPYAGSFVRTLIERMTRPSESRDRSEGHR